MIIIIIFILTLIIISLSLTPAGQLNYGGEKFVTLRLGECVVCVQAHPVNATTSTSTTATTLTLTATTTATTTTLTIQICGLLSRTLHWQAGRIEPVFIPPTSKVPAT
jgi:hypothetical protein